MIAIFDSGVGGLSVWREIVKLLPHESVAYYGDGKNCPYGPKSHEELIKITDEITRFLIDKGADIIVVACNTATADAIDYLRATYPIPFVGMEPAVKPAALATRSGVIGVLATEATLRGRHFTESVRKYSPDIKVLSTIGKGFVELVESGKAESPEAVEIVAKSLTPMIEAGVDQIVLGCTHYPFLRNAIEKVIAGRDVVVLDPAPAVALRTKELLRERNLLSSEDNIPEYTFYTSSDENYRQRLIEMSKLCKN